MTETFRWLLNKSNIQITEQELYDKMIFKDADMEDIQKKETYTISFLDMTNYLKEHSIESRSYKMDWSLLYDTLSKGYAPIVINYEKPDPHFALLLYIQDDYAFSHKIDCKS